VLRPDENDRLLLYNQDPGYLFSETAEPITPAHVDGMVDEIAAAGVDVLFVNPNTWRTNYPSDAWESWWDGYDEWAADNPPLETSGVEKTLHWHHPRHPLRHQMIQQMRRLATQECDYLERALERCRHHGVTPAVSIRMNDQHDVEYPDSQYFSDFYREHPELRLETDRLSGIAGLDYGREPVRDHFFSLIEEILEGYDLECLELDFLSHPPFFDAEDASSMASTMTSFVQRVADRCDSASVALFPRIPANPARVMELGLEFDSWVDADIVDGVTVGTRSTADWQIPVERFRDAVGDVPLYVSIEKGADRPLGFPLRLINSDERLLRGVGAAYAPTSADGLYFFNFFGPREEPIDPAEPLFGELPTLKADSRLRQTSKVYLTSVSDRDHLHTHSSHQVPLTVHPGPPREVSLTLLEEPSMAYSLELLTKRRLSASDIWLQVNDRSIGKADDVRDYHRPAYRRTPGREGVKVRYQVPPTAVREGENRITLRNQTSEPITVDGVEVHVGDSPE
jgi:hypothetical protein